MANANIDKTITCLLKLNEAEAWWLKEYLRNYGTMPPELEAGEFHCADIFEALRAVLETE